MRTDEDRLSGLAEFCALEIATGGPDPQVEVAARADSGTGWFSGCFVSPYTVGAGAALKLHLEPFSEDEEQIERLFVEHRPGLPTRRERRAVWSPAKMARSLTSYSRWARDVLPSLREASYEEVWGSLANETIYYGRYAGMKLIETLHRAGALQARQHSIMPSGAWSPRATLALVLPDQAPLLKDGGNSRRTLAEVDSLAADVKLVVEEQIGREMSWFSYETLLCNYRQSLKGKYPGRSQDRELAHWHTAAGYWGEEALLEQVPFFELRAELFDHRCLGELRGWRGARKELETTVDEHGYMWCDTLFDYDETTDLARPERW